MWWRSIPHERLKRTATEATAPEGTHAEPHARHADDGELLHGREPLDAEPLEMPAMTLVSRVQCVTLVTGQGVWIHFVWGMIRS